MFFIFSKQNMPKFGFNYGFVKFYFTGPWNKIIPGYPAIKLQLQIAKIMFPKVSKHRFIIPWGLQCQIFNDKIGIEMWQKTVCLYFLMGNCKKSCNFNTLQPLNKKDSERFQSKPRSLSAADNSDNFR